MIRHTSLVKLTAAILLVGALPFVGKATVFFSDTFGAGSTLNNATPANPTASSAAYQLLSGKAWVGQSLAANQLRFGMGATTSGIMECQTLFATNPVALVLDGDYIRMAVTFTNTAGLLTSSATTLAFGLFNSGGVNGVVVPVPGGLNGTLDKSKTGFATGYAQGWLGYFGSINGSGGNHRIYNRNAQGTPISGTSDNNQQGLSTAGTGSSPANPAPAQIGPNLASTLSLTVGATYTEVLVITKIGSGSVAITNTLYSGPDTNGSVVVSFGGIATNSAFLTGGFDSLGIGYRAAAATTIDVSSIKVDGSVTAVTGPPEITQQPSNITVPNGGSCAFQVGSIGFNMTYQWHRNGTNLLNGGNISGATSSQLIISPASAADVAANYYVTVTGAGNFSTNSESHSLSLGTAKNLIYTGSGPWDLNTSSSWWDNSLSPTFMFNFGDSVTFDNNGGGGIVTVTGNYLSASTVNISHTSSFYTLNGTGSFAGPGKLIYDGSAQFTINNVNTFTGGTTISNAAANLRLGNIGGLGTGPITFAAAGSKLTVQVASSSSTSINSDLVVSDDANIVIDPADSGFAMVLNGNLSGTVGKTLTIDHGINGAGTNATRIRINGTSTIYNANLNLNDSTFVWSPSQGSGSQTYNGVISGTGKILQKSSTTYLNAQNTYSGGTIPAAGAIGLGADSVGSPIVTSGPIGTGPLLLVNDSTTTLAGSGQLFASGAAHTIANPIQFVSGSNNLTLVMNGTNALTLSGAFTLQGNDGGGAGTNRTIQADNTVSATISGVISDGSLGISLIKTGTNTLFLNAANTYSGLTAVAQGTLAGSGSIAGSVLVTNNARIGGGAASGIGTLSIGGNLTLTNGGGYFRLNRAGFVSDVAFVTGTITCQSSNTITVTNLGANLQAGDTFAVFNKTVAGGSVLTVTGGLTSGLTWSNNLAANGSIVVVVAGTDLAATVSGPATNLPAANFNYTITVTNQGAAIASSVVVTDTIPAGVTFVSASGGGVNNSGVVSWALGSLSPAQSSNLTLTVTAPLFGSITNKATVSSATTDLVPANDTSAQVVTVIAPSSSIPNLTNAVSGSSIALSWPVDHTGWRLQVQTNALGGGLNPSPAAWSTVSGSTTTNRANIIINPANGAVFYRMIYP